MIKVYGKSSESGQILPLAAIVLFALILIGALALDVSGWYSNTAELQSGADAAAVAGATYYAEGDINASGPCHGIGTGQPAATRGVACAAHVAVINNTPLAPGFPKAVSGFEGAPAIEVDALNTSPPNWLAGGLLHIAPHTHASSVVSIIAPGSANGVVPVAVNVSVASQWSSGQEIGPLLFDGPRAGNGFIAADICGNGESMLGNCIQNGDPNPVTVGQSVNAIPGNRWQNGPHVQNIWKGRYGDTVYAPVYQPSDPGGDCPCTIQGFATYVIDKPPVSDTNVDDIYVTFLGEVVAPTAVMTPGQFFGTAQIAITQ